MRFQVTSTKEAKTINQENKRAGVAGYFSEGSQRASQVVAFELTKNGRNQMMHRFEEKYCRQREDQVQKAYPSSNSVSVGDCWSGRPLENTLTFKKCWPYGQRGEGLGQS